MTSRPDHAILLAALIGLVAVWAGILLAYDSFYWTPGHGWPVSFFIVSVIFLFYVAVDRMTGARRKAEGYSSKTAAASVEV